jgi:hypothetical protein
MAPLNLIEEDNLPQVEVIAKNFDERNYLSRDIHTVDVLRALEREMNRFQIPENIRLDNAVNMFV